MQINLRHSKAATLHLSQILLDLDIDIVLVQEPYAKRNLFLVDIIQIPYLPDQYTVHHNLNKDHAYGAVILTKRYLMAKTIANISSNEYIGISLFNNSKTPIHLFSVYCRPSKNLSTSIDPIGKFPHLKNSIICMDSNAKNKLWGSKTRTVKVVN